MKINGNEINIDDEYRQNITTERTDYLFVFLQSWLLFYIILLFYFFF